MKLNTERSVTGISARAGRSSETMEALHTLMMQTIRNRVGPRFPLYSLYSKETVEGNGKCK